MSEHTAPNNQPPLSKLLQAELKTILEDAIYTLPEKYRIVFVMRQIEDMSAAEKQGCLGLSEAKVKLGLNRARINRIYNLMASEF